ncbi:MAG: hypothetical protein G5702_05680 [Serratia symbiotica]|nr:hypothetical protein [Serratia symbiotica]
MRNFNDEYRCCLPKAPFPPLFLPLSPFNQLSSDKNTAKLGWVNGLRDAIIENQHITALKSVEEYLLRGKSPSKTNKKHENINLNINFHHDDYFNEKIKWR